MTEFWDINKALAEEFGKGKVTIRRRRNQKYSFRIWFLNENTSQEDIEKAKQIVNSFMESTFGELEYVDR